MCPLLASRSRVRNRVAHSTLSSGKHRVGRVQRLAKGFELAAFRPSGDAGPHDIHFLRKPAASSMRIEQLH